MNKITINGVEYNFNGGNVTVTGNQIFVDGQPLDTGLGERVRFDVHIHGDVENLKTDGSANVTGNVKGNVDARGSVTAGNIGGYANAGGSIHCGDVGGNVNSGGSAHAKDVRGNIRAGGNVRHGS